MAGDQHHLGFAERSGLAENLHAAAVGQLQVEQTMSGCCSADCPWASRSERATAQVKPSAATTAAMALAAGASASTMSTWRMSSNNG